MSHISSITVDECSYPLSNPYKLSFVTLSEFQTIRVTISLKNGESRVAEVVPLEGYSDESYVNVLSRLKERTENMVGQSLEVARKETLCSLKDKPFSATGILTAIDLFNFQPIEKVEAEKFNTLIPFSTSQLLRNEIKQDWFSHGKTYKLKLSGDLSEDQRSLSKLNFLTNLDCSIRVDANQAYKFDQARLLLEDFKKNIAGTKVEYFEQLLDSEDWNGQKELVSIFPKIEFMLDEPIVDFASIDKARSIGVNYVKLKLYKQGGIIELIAHTKYANQNGLRVILGNGVATWPSNQVELSVYAENRSWFSGVHEANGYKKVLA